MNRRNRIGIIGLGMVGEPIRKWFEEEQDYQRGEDLFCYDADPKKSFNDDYNKADYIFVAVPTPSNPDGSCNISIVESVVSQIDDGKVIIIKSTVTPGTTERLQKEYPGKKFLFNPEFLTESQAWVDFLRPARQLIGYTSKSKSESIEVLRMLPDAQFERPHTSDYVRGYLTATEAEICKYFSNVFGAVKVAISNIFADICFATGALNDESVSYENVRDAVSADSRIGKAWTNVNHGNYCGFGAYCFPKDLRATIKYTEKLYAELIDQSFVTKKEMVAYMRGLDLLKAVYKYNQSLIEAQNLTMDEVCRHDKEIVTKNRRAIRVVDQANEKIA